MALGEAKNKALEHKCPDRMIVA